MNLPKVSKPFDNPFRVDVNDAQLTELTDWLTTRIEEMVQAHAERDENIKRWRQVYEAQPFDREGPFEGSSNLHIPLVGWIVDAFHTRLVQSHFGVEPYVRFRAEETTDLETASKIEHLLWLIHQKERKLAPAYMTILDACICGFGVTKNTWQQKYQKITEGGKPKYALRYNGPKTERIAPEDFYIYAPTMDVDNAQIVGHRFWRRWDDIQRGVALGYYNEDWAKNLEGKAENIQLNEQAENQGLGTATGQDWKDQFYELFELVISYDLDEDGLEEDYLVVVDKANKQILRLINYPYAHGERCYSLYVPFPDGTNYGYSLVGMLEALDEELSTLHNQRIDNNTIVNAPMLMVREGTPFASDNTRAYPGKKIVVSEMDDIKPLVQIPPRDGYGADEDRLLGYAKFRSGMSEINLGQTPKGDQTAYEIEAALAEGSIKIRLIVQLGVQWLVRQAWQELIMTKQFMPDENVVRMTGDINPLSEMTIEDMWQRYDAQAFGNTTTSNKELERQKAVMLRESLKQDPTVLDIDPMTGAPRSLRRWWAVNRDYLKAHGVENWQEYIGPEPAETNTPAAQQSGPAGAVPGEQSGMSEMGAAPASPGPDELAAMALEGALADAG